FSRSRRSPVGRPHPAPVRACRRRGRRRHARSDRPGPGRGQGKRPARRADGGGHAERRSPLGRPRDGKHDSRPGPRASGPARFRGHGDLRLRRRAREVDLPERRQDRCLRERHRRPYRIDFTPQTKEIVMRVPRGRIVLFTAGFFLALSGLPIGAPGADLHPPATRAEAVKEKFASVEVSDPYRWLEDQKAPETRAWIDEQNTYSESFLRGLSGREALKKHIRELLKVDTTGT